MCVIVGWDVGGTSIKAVTAPPTGEVVTIRHEPRPRGCSIKNAHRRGLRYWQQTCDDPAAIGSPSPASSAPIGRTLANELSVTC
jgi:hypothetical protein